MIHKHKKKILIFCKAILLCFLLTTMLQGEEVNAATIKMTETSITLIKGQTRTIRVKGTKKKVIWSSNHKSVVSVSSKGKIVARKKGTAIITAKVAGKKLRCKVKVEQPYLSENYIAVTTGSTKSLVLKGTLQKIKWHTKKSSVATVTSKGVVKGINPGNTTITATVAGKNYNCHVKVISLQKNYAKVKSFLQKRGKLDQNGNYFIQYKETQEDVDLNNLMVCKITYLTSSDQYKFEFLMESKDCADEGRISCVMYVNVLNSNTANVEIELYDQSEGTITGKAKLNAVTFELWNEIGDEFHVSSTNPRHTKKEMRECCDAYFGMGSMFWDGYLNEKLGIGMEDLGFLKFDTY